MLVQVVKLFSSKATVDALEVTDFITLEVIQDVELVHFSMALLALKPDDLVRVSGQVVHVGGFDVELIRAN